MPAGCASGYRHNAPINTDYQQTDGSKTTDKADAYQYDVVRDGLVLVWPHAHYRNEFEALKQAYAGAAAWAGNLPPPRTST